MPTNSQQASQPASILYYTVKRLIQAPGFH